VWCLVRAVHKFGLDLLQTKHQTNGDQWKYHAVRETRGFDRNCMFSTDRRRDCKGTTHAMKVNRILLSKRLYYEILRVGLYCLPRY